MDNLHHLNPKSDVDSRTRFYLSDTLLRTKLVKNILDLNSRRVNELVVQANPEQISPVMLLIGLDEQAMLTSLTISLDCCSELKKRQAVYDFAQFVFRSNFVPVTLFLFEEITLPPKKDRDHVKSLLVLSQTYMSESTYRCYTIQTDANGLISGVRRRKLGHRPISFTMLRLFYQRFAELLN